MLLSDVHAANKGLDPARSRALVPSSPRRGEQGAQHLVGAAQNVAGWSPAVAFAAYPLPRILSCVVRAFELQMQELVTEHKHLCSRVRA